MNDNIERNLGLQPIGDIMALNTITLPKIADGLCRRPSILG
jgi:hypothetical protein